MRWNSFFLHGNIEIQVLQVMNLRRALHFSTLFGHHGVMKPRLVKENMLLHHRILPAASGSGVVSSIWNMCPGGLQIGARARLSQA